MRKPKILSAIASVLVICATVLSSVSCSREPAPEADPIDDNYRTFYQIFVGSFSDSNGDGIGDLRGIINRFDYLNDGNVHSRDSLGVQGIWLSPIFSSPSYHKYDATDYYEIDWRFGRVEELVELVELAHSRNVKVILDLAINHTSSQHPWFTSFKTARAAGDTSDPYYDYYTAVTTAERKGGVTYQKIAGVDWWYECNFSGDMPELNFDNPKVREEVLDIAKHYLDLGIDGFRFDAVKYIYYGDTDRSVAFWEWYMEELTEYSPDIYTVGECWSVESEILAYYPALNCFNFAMSGAEGVAANTARGTSSVTSYVNYIVSLQDKISERSEDGMMMSFLSNHDMDRIAGSFILDSGMKMAANLYLLLPGSPVIYYGEEIGMRGSRGSANTDANRRLAMLWEDDDVRNPTGSTYSDDKQIQTTVEEQLKDGDSLLSYYCRLLSVRHTYPAIARGKYSAVKHSSELGGFIAEHGEERLLILHNTSDEEQTVELGELAALQGMELDELCEVLGSSGATLDGGRLSIGAKTSVILK